ncbi:mycofactocin-coupled SDR family oxidoreductase [Rudaeicoccus suwonensis]|uniref:SDR family mycofactocin-dependent oxidoreductase n=1 Tax=Rudaeicoccus suwonensis TaxID=657409 RepID=A0A561E8L7_9MICO|nr:mycofactocin-coupled SDR family oxidoreductase [Rudaeicoccus suwonensis]TWE11947.1 SDR family mycofactocin-dependent oxidoreductase [Rudaeicoccus suwonensis]
MTLAVVTGAASGLGAAVTHRFAARGWHVLAVDACLGDSGSQGATTTDLDQVVARDSGHVTPAVVDVRDLAQLRAAVDAAVAQHGPLVAVVAAAAIIDGGADQWDTDPEQLRRLWETDVLGVWHAATASVPHLLDGAAGGGSAAFCAIASAAAHRGLWHLSAYCTVKHAVAGLVQGLAADLNGRGVTVTGVSPGSMDTPMLAATARLYGLDDVADLARSHTTGQPLPADEVAAVVEAACTLGPAVHGTVLQATAGFSE